MDLRVAEQIGRALVRVGGLEAQGFAAQRAFQPFTVQRIDALAEHLEVVPVDDLVRRLANPLQVSRVGIAIDQIPVPIADDARNAIQDHVQLALTCSQRRRALLDHGFQMVAVLVQLLSRTPLLGDVLLHREVVGGAPVRLANRRTPHVLGKYLTALAPVHHLPAPRASVLQSVPQALVSFHRRLAGFQQAGVAAQHFLPAVASAGDEGVVDIFDATLQIGDDDGLNRLIDRQRQLVDFGVHLLAARDFAFQGGGQVRAAVQRQHVDQQAHQHKDVGQFFQKMRQIEAQVEGLLRMRHEQRLAQKAGDQAQDQPMLKGFGAPSAIAQKTGHGQQKEQGGEPFLRTVYAPSQVVIRRRKRRKRKEEEGNQREKACTPKYRRGRYPAHLAQPGLPAVRPPGEEQHHGQKQARSHPAPGNQRTGR